MGAIEKFVKNQAGRAIDKVQSFTDTIKSSLGRVQGYMGTAMEVAKNGETFVGLQYSAIPSIRTSIRTYVTNIQNELANLHTSISNSNALKGEVAAAAQKYVEAVSKVADAYATSLLAYSDKMYEYGEAYKASDTTLASSVTDEAAALDGSSESYTEQY